jgi:hypothetical protein
METIKKVWNYLLDTKLGFFLFLFVFNSLFVLAFYDMRGKGYMFVIIAILALLLTLLSSGRRWY